MTATPVGFGRRNPHCANCGDERGGEVGHETSECLYRSGMTAGEVAQIQPPERRAEFWEQAIDRYLRSQGIDPDAPDEAECTGLSAAWCPVHGDCACPETPQAEGRIQKPLNDPRCPLHSPTSGHADQAA